MINQADFPWRALVVGLENAVEAALDLQGPAHGWKVQKEKS